MFKDGKEADMCSRIVGNHDTITGLRGTLRVHTRSGVKDLKWIGFSRSETDWSVWEDCDIPAEAFVEKGKKVDLPPGEIIYAKSYRDCVNVVTRQASESERAFLSHGRVPLTGQPRY